SHRQAPQRSRRPPLHRARRSDRALRAVRRHGAGPRRHDPRGIERDPPMSTKDNKEIVLAFYEQAFNDGQPEAAAAAHLGATYTQHNPGAPDGAEGFIGYVHWLRGKFPDLHLDIKRAIAEDDLVVTHSHLHLKPGDRG